MSTITFEAGNFHDSNHSWPEHIAHVRRKVGNFLVRRTANTPEAVVAELTAPDHSPSFQDLETIQVIPEPEALVNTAEQVAINLLHSLETAESIRKEGTSLDDAWKALTAWDKLRTPELRKLTVFTLNQMRGAAGQENLARAFILADKTEEPGTFNEKLDEVNYKRAA